MADPVEATDGRASVPWIIAAGWLTTGSTSSSMNRAADNVVWHGRYMFTFTRETLVRQDFLGIDSVQGLLELGTWYGRGGIVLCWDVQDKDKHDSVYFQFLQLEEEGYVNLVWTPYTHEERSMVQLKQVGLTTDGRKLLAELQDKSRSGRLRRRMVDLFWVVLAAIVTTLLILRIKGI